MKKSFIVMIGLLIAGSTAFASPVSEFEQGKVAIEFGGTLNSKFTGKGSVAGEAGAQSGYKFAVTAGLGNDLAIQYRGAKFKSEEFTAHKTTQFGPITATLYGKADIKEINLIQRINPNVALVVGWIQNTFSYSKMVQDGTISTIQVGVIGTKKINEQSTLFASLIGGKNVLLWEAGISQKLTENLDLHVSYGERDFKKVTFNIPAANVYEKEDYKLKGISCMLSAKL